MTNKKRKQKIITFISIITIIILIGLIVGINVIKVNIANKKFNSSNSSSSTANLIPEYIKEGITLGGVTGTLKILDTSDATAKPEDILYGKTGYVNGKKITGTRVTRDMLEVGDYVAYTPDTANSYSIPSSVSGYTSNQTITQETLKWQIMSINEDGTVDLVSSTSTNQDLYIEGATGYNNGVYLLNDISAKLYSNSELGLTARSINAEDIERHMTQEGIEFIHSYVGDGIAWGKTQTFTGSNSYYPNLYSEENGSGINSTNIKNDGIEQSDSYYTEPSTDNPPYGQASSSGLTVTQRYYKQTMSSKYYESNKFYDLIHNGSYFWIATRYLATRPTFADFGLRNCDDNVFYGSVMMNSKKEMNLYHNYIRIVVTLNTNIKFYSGDGSEENPYQIEIM